jgi:hypothetical protein
MAGKMLWGRWDLPEDASMEILSRLAVKFLASCKCISKSWYALITNPNFITKHLKISRNPHRGGTILMRVHKFKPLRLHTLYNETLRMSGVVDPRELFQYEVAGLSMFGPCNGILYFFATPRKDRHWHNYNRALLEHSQQLLQIFLFKIIKSTLFVILTAHFFRAHFSTSLF